MGRITMPHNYIYQRLLTLVLCRLLTTQVVLAHKLTYRLREALRVYIAVDLRVVGQRYATCLLRHNNDDSIRHLAHTQSGTVTHTIGLRHILACYWKYALSSNHPIATDNHTTIVQRSILEEDILDERLRHLSVDSDTALLHNAEVVRLLDDNESTNLLLTHTTTSIHDRLKLDVVLDLAVAEVEDARQPLEALTLAAYGLKEVADLGLEDDDDGYYTHRDNLSEDCREEHQIERLNQYPQQVYEEYTQHNIWCTRSLHSAINTIKQRRHEEDVNKIDKVEWYKAHSLRLESVRK